MMHHSADIKKLPRRFLPADFEVTTWQNLLPYFENLEQRNLDTLEALQQWLADLSELEAAVSEEVCWRQIRMTCDTENKALEEAFNYFVTHIQPPMQPFMDALNRKLADCPFAVQLAQTDPAYAIYLRSVKKNIELFKQENIPLQSELSILQQQFGQVTGRMTVQHNGQEYTLQQAARFLQSKDRTEREAVYRKIQERRLQDRDALNELYTRLIGLRQKVAENTGFANYRDYKFKELGRFDYTPDDCSLFQQGVKDYVVPLVNTIYEHKRQLLGVPTLRPWDLDAEPEGVEPLRPFENGADLLEKSIACLDKLNPFFADCFRTMQRMGHFDLESRKGKAPGGYNCPLAESGAPFIFMNAAGQMDDVTTMVHEGGHAVHSFLAHQLPLSAFKEYPMEIAEVASMAMELFTMDHWQVFFSNPNELKRAKIHQLERAITIFPWIATIDKFQHWVYLNPNHTTEERTTAWLQLLEEYKVTALDTTGLEEYRQSGWQRQLHLFEVPFYYIEYGIAQLGAIGLWMQYKQHPEQAIERYIKALSLGGTRSLPELYAAAGIRFDFSPEHIKTLTRFVAEEMEAILKA
jgi:oligoendopeptidase F